MAGEIKVTVQGRDYPFRQTMGAALRFKKVTGKEATAVADGNLSDITAWLWCCIASACRRDGIEFPYSLEDFADSIDVEEATGLLDSLAAKEAPAVEGQKKI